MKRYPINFTLNMRELIVATHVCNLARIFLLVGIVLLFFT